MKYIRPTWSRFLISIFGGGVLAELIFVISGDPNRQRNNGDLDRFTSLFTTAIIFLTLTFIVNSKTIKFTEPNDKSPEVFPNKVRTKYLIYILACSFISVILYTIFVQGRSILENLRTSLGFVFMVLPILSFIVGLIIALVPYKQFDFDKRYKRAYWIGLLSLNAIYALFNISMVIMALIKERL